jgi:N-6 DNA Methylase
LYVEACLKAVMPGGRVGILVPNGYLGNRSERYLEFRRWLLRNARVAAVIGFPRFTFKKSGADVSASAVILERRREPLSDLSQMPDYPIHFNLVEKVGWDLQSKYATRIFKRDPRDGTELRDAAGASACGGPRLLEGHLQPHLAVVAGLGRPVDDEYARGVDAPVGQQGILNRPGAFFSQLLQRDIGDVDVADEGRLEVRYRSLDRRGILLVLRLLYGERGCGQLRVLAEIRFVLGEQ